jgi:carboxylesterase
MTDRCRTLLLQECEQYDKDYTSSFIEGVSKSKIMGSPIFLENVDSEYGILLMHGYLAQPEEVRLFAEYLHAKGYSVYVPRLPGHGTTPEDLLTRSWIEWYDASRRGYEIIRECAPKIIAAGFSMGAGLALLNASQHPDEFCAVVSVSAPVRMKGWGLRHARLIYVLQRITRSIGLKIIPLILEHDADNPEINYTGNPIRGLVQLHSLMHEAEKGLINITIPVCAVQADEDTVMYRSSLETIMKKIRSAVKEKHFVRCNIHGIVRGDVSREVFETAGRFLDKVRALTA